MADKTPEVYSFWHSGAKAHTLRRDTASGAETCHIRSGLQAFCYCLFPWGPRLTSPYLFGAFS